MPHNGTERKRTPQIKSYVQNPAASNRLSCASHQHNHANNPTSLWLSINGQPSCCKSEDAAVREEEYCKPLAVPIHQNTAGGPPICEQNFKHCQKCTAECSIIAEHLACLWTRISCCLPNHETKRKLNLKSVFFCPGATRELFATIQTMDQPDN